MVLSTSRGLRAINRKFFAAVSNWTGPRIEAGELRRLDTELLTALWIGPSQDLARHWLGGRSRTSLPTAAPVLADAAWRCPENRGGRDHMTITYDDVVRAAREERTRSLITVEREDAHATVTLDDPDRLNPLCGRAHRRSSTTSSRSCAGDPEIRAIVLTGRDPAFSAGGDLRLMVDVGQRQLAEAPGGATEIWRWIKDQFGGIARLITRTDKAFIAAVNGPAAGVGLAFALACDVLLLSERARIVPAFGRIGLRPRGRATAGC